MPPPSFYFHIILCSQGIHEVIYDKDLEDRQAQGGSLIFSPSSLAAHQAVVARLNLKSRSSLEAGLWGRQSQGCLCWWFFFGGEKWCTAENHYQQYYIPIICLYQYYIPNMIIWALGSIFSQHLSKSHLWRFEKNTTQVQGSHGLALLSHWT